MSQLPRLPGYELIESFGGGPMTCVWSAREWATGDLVAVKMPRPGWPVDTARTLIHREARAGLAARHPHLIRIRAACPDNPPFLVMDLLPGESLRQRLQRDYQLDLPTALWVARQTAAALAAMHRTHFVHGDVKPENIRLTGPGTAVLIDLGFAHRPGENEPFLAKGLILGTANYLAPELCAAEKDADERADLFALGVMLFEMLTGRLPYPAGSMTQTLHAHCHDWPSSLRDCPGDWPRPLRRLLRRLLARRPADRPSAYSATQDLVALEIATLRQPA